MLFIIAILLLNSIVSNIYDSIINLPSISVDVGLEIISETGGLEIIS